MTNFRLLDQCEELRAAATDETVSLIYVPGDREYTVTVADLHQVLPNLGYPREVSEWRTIDPFEFCPWSGGPLPGDLHTQRIDLLENELGIEYSVDLDQTLFPPEFQTEEWWLRRNIGSTNEVLREDWIKPAPVDKRIVVRAIDPAPGFRRYGEKSPHMCEQMAAELNDVRIMIAYLPHTREYGFRVLLPGEPVDEQPIEIRVFRYCPWCGDSLPESLRATWEMKIAALGLAPDVMDYPSDPPPALPSDLASDAWWRAEKL